MQDRMCACIVPLLCTSRGLSLPPPSHHGLGGSSKCSNAVWFPSALQTWWLQRISQMRALKPEAEHSDEQLDTGYVILKDRVFRILLACVGLPKGICVVLRCIICFGRIFFALFSLFFCADLAMRDELSTSGASDNSLWIVVFFLRADWAMS